VCGVGESNSTPMQHQTEQPKGGGGYEVVGIGSMRILVENQQVHEGGGAGISHSNLIIKNHWGIRS
jgi:hypothetical protein